MSAPSNLLVVSAWEPELAQFRELTAGRVATEAIGVGLVEAAIGATRCVIARQPDHAIFLGTAGALSADLTIGEVVTATSVVLAGRDLPAPMPREVVLAAPLALGLRPVRVVNTIGVTTSDDEAASLAVLAHVEHLEAFAFARACVAMHVDCTIVLGIANPVGAAGRASWLAHHEEASARAGEALARALETLTRDP